jgi:hypothetical protein
MTYLRTLLIALLIPVLLAGCDTFGGNEEEEETTTEPSLVTITQINIEEWPGTVGVYANFYNLSSGRALWEGPTEFLGSTNARKTYPNVDVSRPVDGTRYNVGMLRSGIGSVLATTPAFTTEDLAEDGFGFHNRRFQSQDYYVTIFYQVE